MFHRSLGSDSNKQAAYTNRNTTTATSKDISAVGCDVVDLLNVYSEMEGVFSSMELAFFDAQESLSQLLWENASKSPSFLR